MGISHWGETSCSSTQPEGEWPDPQLSPIEAYGSVACEDALAQADTLLEDMAPAEMLPEDMAVKYQNAKDSISRYVNQLPRDSFSQAVGAMKPSFTTRDIGAGRRVTGMTLPMASPVRDVFHPSGF